jgi:hypothetical protein
MIDGEVEVLEVDTLPQQRGDGFAARTGFDPRALAPPTGPAPPSSWSHRPRRRVRAAAGQRRADVVQ